MHQRNLRKRYYPNTPLDIARMMLSGGCEEAAQYCDSKTLRWFGSRLLQEAYFENPQTREWARCFIRDLGIEHLLDEPSPQRYRPDVYRENTGLVARRMLARFTETYCHGPACENLDRLSLSETHAVEVLFHLWLLHLGCRVTAVLAPPSKLSPSSVTRSILPFARASCPRSCAGA